MRIPEVSDVCLTMLMLQIDVLAFLEKAVSSHLEVTRTFGKVEVAGEVKLRLDCCRVRHTDTLGTQKSCKCQGNNPIHFIIYRLTGRRL
jgi:hypothetical protein